MSIVVVVKKDKKIVIAADSCYSVGSINIKSVYLNNRSKILTFGDTYLGVVGASAHEHVLADIFRRHGSTLSFESEEEIFKSYLQMHEMLKDEYFINTQEGGDSEEYESSQIQGLVANSRGIFGMFSWREVYEYERFWAIGSGSSIALGALFSVYDTLSDAREIAETAVRAACEFDDGCELPLVFHSLELE